MYPQNHLTKAVTTVKTQLSKQTTSVEKQENNKIFYIRTKKDSKKKSDQEEKKNSMDNIKNEGDKQQKIYWGHKENCAAQP